MHKRVSLTLLGCFSLVFAAACNSVTGLDDFSVSGSTKQAQCTTNADCMGTNTTAQGADSDAICVKATGACVQVKSADCTTVTGDATDDRAIFVGSLFQTTGTQASTNMDRQQSAQLAVEQINAVGGVPSPSGNPRKLVMVSCDGAVDLVRAAGHLVNDLKVSGIVGPNNSQDVLDVSNMVSVSGDAVVITPTAIASSIANLVDNDLTWLMMPTDVQRAPLMISQINELETSLKAARSASTIKLGVIFRDDALGEGTRTSLNDLILNGKPISDSINIGKNIQISPYDYKSPNANGIVQKYVAFAPDIIVLAGTAEAVTGVMMPLEAQWTAPHRPHYIVIDPTKTPDLLNAAAGNDDLRRRVRGTGFTSGPESQPVNNAFKVNYTIAYPGMTANTSGMGLAYDATYAIAFAHAAAREAAPNGAAIARGLRKLAGGPMHIEIGPTTALSAFQKLAAGESIDALGTYGPLAWDANGAVMGGTLEMWCIGAASGTVAYQSSGLTFDLATQKKSGQYTQCSP